MQKIFIVEDDEKLRSELEIFLNNNGYIGSIVQTKDPKNKYKIEYSDEEYTAVTELKDRLYKIKKDRRAGDKDDRW